MILANQLPDRPTFFMGMALIVKATQGRSYEAEVKSAQDYAAKNKLIFRTLGDYALVFLKKEAEEEEVEENAKEVRKTYKLGTPSFAFSPTLYFMHHSRPTFDRHEEVMVFSDFDHLSPSLRRDDRFPGKHYFLGQRGGSLGSHGLRYLTVSKNGNTKISDISWHSEGVKDKALVIVWRQYASTTLDCPTTKEAAKKSQKQFRQVYAHLFTGGTEEQNTFNRDVHCGAAFWLYLIAVGVQTWAKFFASSFLNRIEKEREKSPRIVVKRPVESLEGAAFGPVPDLEKWQAASLIFSKITPEMVRDLHRNELHALQAKAFADTAAVKAAGVEDLSMKNLERVQGKVRRAFKELQIGTHQEQKVQAAQKLLVDKAKAEAAAKAKAEADAKAKADAAAKAKKAKAEAAAKAKAAADAKKAAEAEKASKNDPAAKDTELMKMFLRGLGKVAPEHSATIMKMIPGTFAELTKIKKLQKKLQDAKVPAKIAEEVVKVIDALQAKE